MSTVQNNPLVPSTLNSLWNINGQNTDESEKAKEAQKQNSVQNKKAQNAYGFAQIDKLAQAAEAAFKGLGLGPGDRVTFNRIIEYRDKLQDDFADTVKKGLKELGIDENTEYQVVTNYSGEGVKIITDSPDKEKIEKYFANNPKVVDQFKEIQYLDNLDKTRTNQNISPSLLSSRLQLQAMSSMFNSNPTSSIMSNGMGGSFFGMGLAAII